MKNHLLLFSLFAIVALSGCIGQIGAPLKFKNDIITVEDVSIDTLNPYAGSPVSLSFNIKNNGEKSVDFVEVNFFDIQVGEKGFKVEKLECENGDTPEKTYKCVFEKDKKLEIFDVRKVGLTLVAPPSDVILSPRKFTLSYSISYKYSGSREVHIPIIDGTTRKTPLSRFTQSEPTFGPIQVDFVPPIGRETKQDNRIITEHFGVIDKPFKVEMNFRHVGSSSIGKIQKVIIGDDIGESIKFDFKGTLKQAEGFEDVCNFPGIVKDTTPLSVPGELFCNLEVTQSASKSRPFASSTSLPEITGIITVDYNYDYQFIRSETIEVQPLPKAE